MSTYTTFSELFKLAHKLGQAKQTDAKEEIKKAKKIHDEYLELCRNSDGMMLQIHNGDL